MKKDTGWKTKTRECNYNFLKWGEYMKRAQLAERKVAKLKQLMTLTDPSVSDQIIGETQIKQWIEYCSAFPDEKIEALY